MTIPHTFGSWISKLPSEPFWSYESEISLLFCIQSCSITFVFADMFVSSRLESDVCQGGYSCAKRDYGCPYRDATSHPVQYAYLIASAPFDSKRRLSLPSC